MKQDIIDLLEFKEFYELTKDEKTLVLSQISEKEYSNQRAFILSARAEMKAEKKTIIAPPISESKAFAHLQAKNTTKTKRVYPLFLSYRIPAWTAAAAFIILYFALTGIFSRPINGNESNQNKLALVDTVFIEKQVFDTIYLNNQSSEVTSKNKKTNSHSSNPEITQVKKNPSQEKYFSKDELALLGQLEGRVEPLDFTIEKHGKNLIDDRIGQLVIGN